MVLQDSQPGRGRQLLLFQTQQVVLHVADLHEHFVFQLVRLLHFLSLFVGDLSELVLFLGFEIVFKFVTLVEKCVSLLHVSVVLF